MKTTLLKVVVGLLFSSLKLMGAPESYELEWASEFKYGIDKNVWTLVDGVRGGAINSWDAVQEKDGYLVISPFSKDGKNYSAMLTTKTSFSAKFGYWEARVKLETKSGAWSDWWLYNDAIADDNSRLEKDGAEIDLFEHREINELNEDMRNCLLHCLHWNGYSYNHQNIACRTNGISCGEFHIIGLLWTSTEYIFYVDGKEVWRAKEGVSHQPLFPVLSVEITRGKKDSFWAGKIPEKGYDGSPMMTIDYIRYYKQNES